MSQLSVLSPAPGVYPPVSGESAGVSRAAGDSPELCLFVSLLQGEEGRGGDNLQEYNNFINYDKS